METWTARWRGCFWWFVLIKSHKISDLSKIKVRSCCKQYYVSENNIWDKVFMNWPTKIGEDKLFKQTMIFFQNFKGCLVQILLGPLMTSLSCSEVSLNRISFNYFLFFSTSNRIVSSAINDKFFEWKLRGVIIFGVLQTKNI